MQPGLALNIFIEHICEITWRRARQETLYIIRLENNMKNIQCYKYLNIRTIKNLNYIMIFVSMGQVWYFLVPWLCFFSKLIKNKMQLTFLWNYHRGLLKLGLPHGLIKEVLVEWVASAFLKHNTKRRLKTHYSPSSSS